MEGGAARGEHQHMILPNILKNCLKLRKFWIAGAEHLDPPLETLREVTEVST